MKYYIDDSKGYRKDVTDFEPFQEYLPSDATLKEHLQAQIQHIKEVDAEYKLQPIIVGMTSDKFQELVDKLCRMYSGFSKKYFMNRNSIQLEVAPQSMPVIWITDSEKLTKIDQN